MRKTNNSFYNIPDLTIKDIIQYFSDFDIHIKQSDIIKPTHQFVIKLYESILKTYTNEDPGMLSQIECNSIAPDESTSFIMLYKKLYNFLSKIGLESFNLKDLYPDSKRLINILSIVINFSMYRDSKKHIYERIYKLGEERAILREDVESKINQRLKEINKFKSEIKIHNSNKISMEKEIAELENELKEAINIQKSLVSEIEKLKNERDDSNDKLNSYQLLIMNVKQDITGLKTQIISDPSKLMLLLKEMRELVNKERESLRDLERSKNDYNSKIEYFSKSIDEIKRIIKITLEIKEEEEKIKEIEKSVENIELEISNIESSISVSKIRMSYLNRQISHLESKLYNLQDSDKACSESISSKMNNLKNSYETISEQRSSIKTKIEENINTSKNIEREIIKVKTEYENDINEIINILYNIKDKNMTLMKSYKQKNSKILFKTDEKPKDDKTCEEISKVCLEICRRCENKDENEFPIAKIKELIKLNNKLMDGTENKKINKNYIEYINQNKESLGYFLEKQNEEKEVKNIYEKKKMLFNKFKEDISKYI